MASILRAAGAAGYGWSSLNLGGTRGSRSSAIRSRRGRVASCSTVLTTAANGTARIAPTTPSRAPKISTATIVVKPESEIALR